MWYSPVFDTEEIVNPIETRINSGSWWGCILIKYASQTVILRMSDQYIQVHEHEPDNPLFGLITLCHRGFSSCQGRSRCAVLSFA